MFARWSRRLLPAALNTRPSEWSRAAIGVSLGTLFSVWACAQLFGLPVALHLIGPLGASAVLLFAVSSGALAQPWSIIGSYGCATLVSLMVVHFLDRGLGSASLAVGLALLAMCLLRCLHPPAGALALLMVIADPDTVALGWQVLEPVMLSALCLLLIAIGYNNLTRVRYPKVHVEPPGTFIASHVPGEPPGITRADLEHALAQMQEFIDVTPEDLEQLIITCEAQAKRRSIGEVFSARR
ncbi:HPP family protein [Pseudomonas gingeri NCPPB 3146 = LMG 5327]|uniref:HPP family protein n=3 Tax=Pseudomonas gingeri TaxID=117681 RepID=A0A7Y7XWD3_9PSED|nr:HPP family protein [Pseudomonas gingeri]NWC13494.1 HPP family protein [Pseudomonas gingeri]PNQ93792.1 HPP family protein [Pseudomonas gingeri NCPPB 3146 = LMG 5327]